MNNKTQSRAAAKSAAPAKEKKTNAQLVIPETAKTAAEIIEEQIKYFEKKNSILRKMRIFERRAEKLQETLQAIEKQAENSPEDMFTGEEYRLNFSISKQRENICSIVEPTVIGKIIKATLEEIEKHRQILEVELLMK